MLILPVIYILSHVFVIFIDIRLHRFVSRRFPAKRKFLFPFLVFFLFWPTLVLYWMQSLFDITMSVASPGAYLVRQGFWYTFDTRQPLLGFMYFNKEVRFYLPALLALADVLISGVLVCVPIYLITLIRRWWIK